MKALNHCMVLCENEERGWFRIGGITWEGSTWNG